MGGCCRQLFPTSISGKPRAWKWLEGYRGAGLWENLSGSNKDANDKSRLRDGGEGDRTAHGRRCRCPSRAIFARERGPGATSERTAPVPSIFPIGFVLESPTGAAPTPMTIFSKLVLAISVSAIMVSIVEANSAAQIAGKKQNHDWPIYGGTPQNNHFSPLSQINRQNVSQLAVAWTYDTEESGGLQSSPIIVDGTLYGLTPTEKVFALNAATGKLLWKFDSGIKGTQPDRGLAYWSDESNAPQVSGSAKDSVSHKDQRILVGVMNYVYALDAATGQPIPAFGNNGRIDLRDDLGRDPAEQSIYMTTPAVIYKDLMIVGGREAETLPASPGDVRAYDVRTGKLRWSFHTIPHPGEFGYDTWPQDAWKSSGAANNWAGMTVDRDRGILYAPTGSAAFDFYGGDRIGDDLFADSLLALNADTGERIWHFQGVKHDLWDRDFPSPPTLATVERNGKQIAAAAQTTKHGFDSLFEPAPAEPLFPIEYPKYPHSDLPGEVAAEEQPLPTKPGPYARQRLTEDLLTNRTPEAHQWALEQFRTFRSEGQFVPLSTGKNTVIFPGFDGGAEWGGSAFDPESGILYVNSNDIAWAAELAENTGDQLSGRGIYQSQCTICHRDDMKGSPPLYPSLVGVGNRLTQEAIRTTIQKGRGRMPAFPNLA